MSSKSANRFGNVVHVRLRQLFEDEEYDLCVKEFAALELRRPLTSNELVQKGRCILLGSGEMCSPADAEEAYRRALDFDSEYVPALIELGWYYYSTDDNASRAVALFEQALKISTEHSKEAIQGRDECLEELGSVDVET